MHNGQLIFDKVSRKFDWEIDFSTNNAETTGFSHAKE